jgi:hypothetical protein
MLDALKNLGDKAINALARRLDDGGNGESWDGRYTDPRPPQERAFCEQFSDETDVERLRRQCFEYFGIIERIEKERDGLWRMYRVSVSEHLNAQALLERHLMSTRRQLGRAVNMLNKMRKEQELEPIKKPDDLEPYEGDPVGTAEAYAKGMIELCGAYNDALNKARPDMTDGKKRRDAVDPDGVPAQP